MLLSEILGRAAADAAKTYREAADLEHDNQFNERVLGPCMALSIHRHCHAIAARAEHRYVSIAQDAGVKAGIDRAKNSFDGFADLAIYRAHKPLAVAEIKKFDEDARNPGAVAADVEKLANFAPYCGIPGYVVAFVASLAKREASVWVDQIGDKAGRAPTFRTEDVLSRDKTWRWQVAVWLVGDNDVNIETKAFGNSCSVGATS